MTSAEGAGPRKIVLFAGLLLAALLVFFFFGFTGRQVESLVLVLALVLGTVLFWEMRLSIALLGCFLLLATGVLTVGKFIEFSSINIILFLAGMMVFVGFLEKNAFFEYFVGKLLGFVGGGGKRVLVLLLILSALFSALVDEVTSILFMLSIMLHFTSKLKIDPIPFVMLTVFATNIGSSATAVGNPVGVMIALNAKLSFSDFLSNATPVAFAALLVGIAAAYFYFRREIDDFAHKLRSASIKEFVQSQAGAAGGGKRLQSTLLFFGVVLALALHAQIENSLGLEKNTMLLGVALGAAGIVLLLEAQHARHFIETKVDWWTLLFFMMLFASVGALEESGVMQSLATSFASFAGGNSPLAMAGIMVSSGILSAFLDNVLAVAVFIPLVHDLQATAVAGNYLWWALLFGATLFGNMTIIGSTANIVALGLIEKRGLRKIEFVEWLKPGLLVVAVTAGTAFALLYFRTFA